jgi:hypothetical protein
VPVDRCDEVKRIYRTHYEGFTARHFHEHLVRDHGLRWRYSWTKVFLQSRNSLPKAERRGAHRRKRPRRPLPGTMLHLLTKDGIVVSLIGTTGPSTTLAQRIAHLKMAAR